MNRSLAYNNIDGVGELGMGFMCLGFATLQWLQIHAGEHAFWNRPYGGMLFLFFMVATIHYGSKAIKSRITYPRTGFVEYRKRDAVWIPMILGGVVSAAFAALLALALRSHWQLTTPASLVGLLFAVTYAHGIARTVRWKWIVVAIMAPSSLLLAMLPAKVLEAVVNHSWTSRIVPAKTVGAFLITLALYGALLLVSGGITFYLYLRHTPVPAQEQQ